MTKRIVVTGASGNVGTALLRRLTADPNEYDVVGVVRRPPPRRGPYRSVGWHSVDVAAPNAGLRLRQICEGADCVVHLAWSFQPTRNVDYLYRVGVGGTTALLWAAHDAGVDHFVHMSSVGAYAAGAYGRRVDESWSTAGIPSSIYSRTKSAAETLLDDYGHRRDGRVMPVARLRPGLIVQHDAAAALRRYTLPAWLPPTWLTHLPLLPLDRSFVFSFVHAEDVADAIVRIIDRRSAGAFNLAAEPPVRRSDLAAMLGARAVHLPSRLLRPLVQASWRMHLQPVDRGWLDMAFSAPLLDTGRAQTELGWTPTWSSLDALADVGAGFRANGEAPGPVLQSRPAGDELRRDLTAGPLTTREIS
jgi:nucleoside-diphosphate-sugar epimerase